MRKGLISPFAAILVRQMQKFIRLLVHQISFYSMLNDIYNGAEVEERRMKRVVGLFRLTFVDTNAARPELAGAPVFLGLAMTPDSTIRMKPQNLLMNLPLARRA